MKRFSKAAKAKNCRQHNLVVVLLAAMVILVQATEASAGNPSMGSRIRTASVGANTASAMTATRPMSVALSRNRAKTLGEQASASGTRYVMVDDLSVRNLRGAREIGRSLQPIEVELGRLRVIEVVVDVRRDLVAAVPIGGEAHLGSVRLLTPERDGGRETVADVKVNVQVVTANLVVIQGGRQ